MEVYIKKNKKNKNSKKQKIKKSKKQKIKKQKKTKNQKTKNQKNKKTKNQKNKKTKKQKTKVLFSSPQIKWSVCHVPLGAPNQKNKKSRKQKNKKSKKQKNESFVFFTSDKVECVSCPFRGSVHLGTKCPFISIVTASLNG